MNQCQSVTTKGFQCKREALPGSRFCWQHDASLAVREIGADAAAWIPKQPLAVDVYQGEYPVDLANLKPYLCIFRASAQFSDHNRAEDSRAKDYSDLCKSLGIKRGMYHFLRPNGITEQADLFLSVWDKLGGAELRPVVDVEVDPETAGVGRGTWAHHIKTFIDLVQEHTGLSPIIYTSLYFWEFTNHPGWASDYDLWAAWYPYEPDNYSSLPANRTPQGFRRLAIWQYAEDGRSQGYLANDYNKLEDWLVEELGSAPPPPEKKVEYFRNKKIEVTHDHYTKGGNAFDYHIIKFARADIKRIYTTPGPITLEALTEDFLTDNNLHIATNMDEVISGTRTPKGWGVANGVTYKNSTTETGVQFDKDNNVLGMAWKKLPGAWNIACGSNILVEDGQVYPGLPDTSADPRTILAYNDTYIFFFMVDGRLKPNEPGVTLLDIATFIADYGLANEGVDGKINAHNLDGGGSSRAAVLNDSDVPQILNVPSEKRPVINHIGFELEEGAPPPPPPPPPPPSSLRALEYKYGKRVKTWLESDKYSPRELNVKGDTDTRLIPAVWAKKEYYRVKRDQETNKWDGDVRNSAPAPAVWIVGDRAFQMTRRVQFFCADLLALSKFGTLFSDLSGTERSFIGSAYRGVYKYAFNNGTGYEEPGNPRVDYINDRDQDAPLPKFDKIRVCSDNIIAGRVDGTDLLVDHFSAVPSSYTISILEDPRVFRATIIRTDGSTGEFPQLDGAPVYIPLMSNFDLRIPLEYLEKL